MSEETSTNLVALITPPTNTPGEFHIETTWKRTFPRRINVKYRWHVCRGARSTSV